MGMILRKSCSPYFGLMHICKNIRTNSFGPEYLILGNKLNANYIILQKVTIKEAFIAFIFCSLLGEISTRSIYRAIVKNIQSLGFFWSCTLTGLVQLRQLWHNLASVEMNRILRSVNFPLLDSYHSCLVKISREMIKVGTMWWWTHPRVVVSHAFTRNNIF